MKKRRLLLAVAILMSSLASLFATGYTPDMKYAKWMPAFSIDNMWQFSKYGHESDSVLEGCYFTKSPGVISWAMMSWKNKAIGYFNNDHNMMWADVFIVNGNNTADSIYLCRIIPYGASDDDGWRCNEIQNKNHNVTYVVSERERDYDYGTAFLFCVTYYTDSVRSLIERSNGNVMVRFRTSWDRDNDDFQLYDESSRLNPEDCVLFPRPAAPVVGGVAWAYHNNQTCVSFSHGLTSTDNLRQLFVKQGKKDTRVPFSVGATAYYHPDSLSEHIDSLKYRDALHLEAYSTESYPFSDMFYTKSDVRNNHGLFNSISSLPVSLVPPTFAQAYNVAVADNQDGTNTVMWESDSVDSSPYDRSNYILERSTSSDFRQNYRTYTVPYQDTSRRYQLTDAHTIRMQGNKTFYYRIHRNSASASELNRTVSAGCNTNYATLEKFEATIDSAEHKVNIRWDYNSGIRNSDLTLNVRYGSNQQLVFPSTKDTCEYRGIVIPECQETQFIAQLNSSTGGPHGVQMTSTVTLPHATPGVIDTMMASAGYYNDRVNVKWQVSRQYPFFSQFIVTRTEFNAADAVEETLATVAFNSGVYDYSYVDYNCTPGTYYIYKVAGLADCDTTLSRMSEKGAIGFSQPYGVVSGQITYNGNQAVKDVSVVAECESQYGGKSLGLSAENRPTIEMPAEMVNQIVTPDAGTIEFFLKVNDAWTQYPVMCFGNVMRLDCENNKLILSAGANQSSEAENALVPGVFAHVAITFATESSQRTVMLYKDGELTASITVPLTGNEDESDNALRFGSDGNGSYLTGNLDEIRIWNTQRTPEEIERYRNIYLNGTEDGLAAYYRCDDNVSRMLFDLSKRGNYFNSHHVPMSNVVMDENNIPAPEQLGHKAYTDANGNYLFNNLPFSAQGTLYNIVPMYGIHEFAPTMTPLYFNTSANTHNNVDFTDISSFPVSGRVTYFNTNYPVAGCHFLVDGSSLCIDEEGEPVESDENGYYEINVPIGKHFITVSKGSHSFVNNGRYPADPYNTGAKIDFQHEITNLTFQDSTFMLVTGRVSGGADEAEKAHGFGLGKAVIGQAEIVLGTPGDLYNLNLDENNERVFTMPQDSIYGTCYSRATTGAATGNQAHNITIKTDSITGEFNVMLPPLDYEVRSIELEHNNGYVAFNLTSIGNIDLSEKETIEVTTDSVALDSVNYSKFSYSAALDAIHYSQPVMTVQQDSFHYALGASTYRYTDKAAGIDETISLYEIGENGEVTYRFGHPCFTYSKENVGTWKISAYEPYVNYDGHKPDTTRQPFRYGVVTVSSDFATQTKNSRSLTDTTVIYSDRNSVTVSGDELLLDNNGNTYYSFLVGEPNILAPYTQTFSVYYQDPSRTRWYDWIGNENNEVIVFGGKVVGSTFETQGPDEIFYVLRDPVGSESYAEWAKGESIVLEKSHSGYFALSAEYGMDFDFGDTTDTYAGHIRNTLGVYNLTRSHGQNSAGFYVDYNGSWEISSTQDWLFVNEETVTTSADPYMVGSVADVYIGKSRNRLFGESEQVYLKRDTTGNYSIDVKPVISVQDSFTTQFNYSQKYIEHNLIPDMTTHRNQLLTQVTAVQYNDTSNYSNITDPVYITTLSPNDPDFGQDGTYKWIYPNNNRIYVDEVKNYNVQIQRWIDAMTDNERCKVMVHNSTMPFVRTLWEQAVYGSSDLSTPFDSVYAPHISSKYNTIDSVVARYNGGWLDQNYSLGGGASLSVSETREYSAMRNGWTETDGFSIGASGEVYKKGIVDGTTLSWSGLFTVSGTVESNTTYGKTSSVSYDFEIGPYDAMTVDVYQSPDGYGPIFAARGGQTSCPYQDAEYTKYYMPGTEIQAATIPVAEPRITVQNPVVSNVPTEESAFFNIQLANVSSVTNALSTFILAQGVYSNPDGALILVNGHELTQDGTTFYMYGGDVVNKTIEVAQTRYDVMDYDSIALIFYTDCNLNDADTIYISAHFVETCADIALSADYNILNNTTEETVEFTIEDFDQQFRNLNGVELQYRRMGDTEWHLLEEFPADSAAVINYEFSFTKPTFPDGTYMFRAVTKCQFGTEWVTNESFPVTVVVDMAEPEPLGEPYPLDGFYTASSQIYVEFNEPIQSNRVLSDNVLVEGVLNAHDVDHSISLLLDHTTAMTNATYNLGSTPFTLEMWLNYSQSGTLFSYANGANTGIEFGIDPTGHLTAKVNGTDYTSTGVLALDTWGYLVVQCDAVNGLLNASYSHDNLNETLFNNQTIGQAAASGNIRLGGNNLVAKIHEVSLWKMLRTTAEALAGRSESKNSYTQGLLSLWHADEGEGFTAADDVRQRNLTLTDDSWAYNHVNNAMHVAAGDTASINVGNAPLNTDKNFVLEFWFRAKGDAVLCSMPEQGFVMSIVNGNLVVGGYTLPITNYLNDAWHHLALIKPKNAVPVVAIDGTQLPSSRLTTLPAFATSIISFGSTSNTNDIDIDEFRLWNVKSTLEAVRLLSGTCLAGDEAGLTAYYPMEEYVTDPVTSQTTTEFSLYDKTDDTHTRAISHTDMNDAQATSAPALVESRPTEYVAHTFTVSNDKIMVNITEDDARIEGCHLEITVKDIVDENGNYSEPIRWTVFVNRNQLIWDNDSYEIEKDEIADTTIELTIVNNSSTVQNWEISGVPSCMTLSQTSGRINPLETLTIDCTIDATAERGENEYELALSGDGGMESYLYITTEVYANEPDWEINPMLYENSMNIVAFAEVEGRIADDDQDMVAAFIDGELAGVTNLQLLPAMGRYYIMMTIFHNSTTSTGPGIITFKYWDASAGKVYGASQAYQTVNDTTFNPITITYQDNRLLGSIVRPIRIVMGDAIEQTIELKRGWNWISYNVVPTSPSFSDILSPYLKKFTIIKDQTGFGEPDTTSGSVRGTIGAMDCSKGYKIKAILPFDMALTGFATNLTPINFAAQQWTWFGYQPQRALTVNAAMSNINPTVGDLVKSQTQFATWDGYQWVGSLKVMMPGQSYVYNNIGNANINFSYPDYSAETSYQMPMKSEAVATYFDPVEPGKYQGNMSITAVVKHAGEAVSEAEVGIFAGSECRAAATYNDGYYFVTVPGDSAVMLTVRVLYNDSVYVLSEGIQYQNDAVVGTLDDPYLIDLKPEATSVVTVADDGEGDRVEKVMIDNEVFIIRNGKMYDILGRPRDIKK